MINHRKLNPYSKDSITILPCPDICGSTCPYGCDSPYPNVDAYPIPPPPPLSPQMSPPVSAEQSGHVSPFVIVIVTLFGSCFFVIIFYLIAVKFLSRWNVFRPRQRQPEDTNEEFLADDRGQLTAIDHPIWYINTTGLQQSVISSITIFRYKKGDHFIESTECAVCLNEFRNDDALRLLPKCSHAFHIHCIDTWLRSHVNCPVCRAGIVCSVATSAPVASNALNFTNLRRNEDSQVENRENGEGLNVNQARDDGFCENGIGTGEIIEVQQGDHGGKDVGIVKISRAPTESSASWVIEGLNDRGMMMMNGGNNKRQPVRRSVSVDSLLAQRISEVCLSACEDSSVSEDQIAGADQDSSNNVGANSAAQRIIRGGSSVAQFLHKRPVRMKRSYSYSERSLFSRQHSRNNSSASSVIPINFPIRKIRQ